jgi:hypothetical protein
MVAFKSVPASREEDTYSNGMVRNALAIASQPAILRFLEINCSSSMEVPIGE